MAKKWPQLTCWVVGLLAGGWMLLNIFSSGVESSPKEKAASQKETDVNNRFKEGDSRTLNYDLSFPDNFMTISQRFVQDKDRNISAPDNAVWSAYPRLLEAGNSATEVNGYLPAFEKMVVTGPTGPTTTVTVVPSKAYHPFAKPGTIEAWRQPGRNRIRVVMPSSADRSDAPVLKVEGFVVQRRSMKYSAFKKKWNEWSAWESLPAYWTKAAAPAGAGTKPSTGSDTPVRSIFGDDKKKTPKVSFNLSQHAGVYVVTDDGFLSEGMENEPDKVKVEYRVATLASVKLPGSYEALDANKARIKVNCSIPPALGLRVKGLNDVAVYAFAPSAVAVPASTDKLAFKLVTEQGKESVTVEVTRGPSRKMVDVKVGKELVADLAKLDSNGKVMRNPETFEAISEPVPTGLVLKAVEKDKDTKKAVAVFTHKKDVKKEVRLVKGVVDTDDKDDPVKLLKLLQQIETARMAEFEKANGKKWLESLKGVQVPAAEYDAAVKPLEKNLFRSLPAPLNATPTPGPGTTPPNNRPAPEDHGHGRPVHDPAGGDRRPIDDRPRIPGQPIDEGQR